MRINPQNLIELLKSAAVELEATATKLASAERFKEAVSLLDPLEERGVFLRGRSVTEKAASLVNRDDYDQLVVLAQKSAPSYNGLGEADEQRSKSSFDALDKAILHN